ncbi:MAG TPA: signal peptidase II [Dehalococcoidia bacterium]|nr:signal peptidase II [Dehalococcoidia bacterium]
MTAGEARLAESSTKGAGGAALRRLRRDAPFFLVAACVLVLDQMTKAFVRSELAIGESWPSEDWLVRILHVTNTGAAFGILQDQGIFLTVTAFIAIGAIAFYYIFPPLEHGLLRVALGLQLGGAVGNLIDRLRFGEVTDFIHFPHYPAFNVADSSIVVGLIVVVGFFVLNDAKSPEKQSDGD